MIRFNIIGKGFLDFENEGGLAFKRLNPFFRFADVELGRSVEFSVPRTDRNRYMLDFGENPAEYGGALRVLHDCQMIYDGGAKMGALSVVSYENNAFKCVFYVDSSEWLDRLQNLNIRDMVTSFTSGVVWGANSNVVNPEDADPNNCIEIMPYEDGITHGANWQYVPSINIGVFVHNLLNTANVPNKLAIDKDLWLIAGSLDGGVSETVTFRASTNTDGQILQVQQYFDTWDENLYACQDVFFGIPIGSTTTPCRFYRALMNVDVTFPTNFPNNCIVPIYSKNHVYKQYIGDYYPGYTQYSTLGQGLVAGLCGEPLAGRTVKIRKGQTFCFIQQLGYTGLESQYGYYGIGAPYSFACEVNRSDNLTLGETWYLQNNLPDMTIFDFLKSVCLAAGLEMIVEPQTGITIRQGSYGETSDFKELKRVVSIDKVKRVVDAWGEASLSVVDFDSEDYVENKIISNYTVSNGNVNKEQSHRCKFSEGDVGQYGILVRNVDNSSQPYKFTAKKWTIARVDLNPIAPLSNKLLQRVNRPLMFGYNDIAQNSTCVVLKAVFTESEFFAITPSTTFLFQGVAYIWTDAQWSNGIVSLTLQRVSQQIVTLVSD